MMQLDSIFPQNIPGQALWSEIFSDANGSLLTICQLEEGNNETPYLKWMYSECSQPAEMFFDGEYLWFMVSKRLLRRIAALKTPIYHVQ